MKRANRLMLRVAVALAAEPFVAVLALGGFGNKSGAQTDADVDVAVAAFDLWFGVQVTGLPIDHG